MNSPQNVLILDDEPGFITEIEECLADEGFRVFSTGLPSEALSIIAGNNIDVGVFDIRLPEMDGLSFLRKAKDKHPEMQVVMMTGYADMPSVVSAMRFGAVDFLSKPFKLAELKETIKRVAKYKSIKNGSLTDPNPDEGQFAGEVQLLGESKAIRGIRCLINKLAAAYNATVLIYGESGTGKELIARAIHFSGLRKENKFIPVNCSSIPDELFENELFGHYKGSYTDAKYDQKGLFEVADKGSLFLDEIGDLKYNMQAKLLRVIEEKKISRLGEYREKEVDVRIIAATNHDLEEMIARKTFRLDLYHRLNIFRIEVPALRERREDIPVLFNHFVGYFASKFNKPVKKIEKSVVPKIMNYSFPGNVRELKNMVERAVLLSEDGILSEDLFNLRDFKANGHDIEMKPTTSFDLNEIERESILNALHQTKNNKSKASALLNISRQALDRKIKKLNIRIKQ